MAFRRHQASVELACGHQTARFEMTGDLFEGASLPDLHMRAVVAGLGGCDDFMDRVFPGVQKMAQHDEMIQADAPGGVFRLILFDLVQNGSRVPCRIEVIGHMGNLFCNT